MLPWNWIQKWKYMSFRILNVIMPDEDVCYIVEYIKEAIVK